MNIVLIVILVVVGGIFVWQAVLFVRDLIRFIKNKKAKKKEEKSNVTIEKDSADDESARKEK